MKIFAEFYKMLNSRPVEQCGDRSMIRLDGRLSMDSQRETAKAVCIERGFDAYQIIRGYSLLDAKPTCSIKIVRGK